MTRAKILFLCVGLACAVACGRKKVETPEQLQAAFQPPPNNPVLTQAKPQVKVWVDQAVTAMKSDDQATAVMTLRSLRGSGELTPDQAMAVSDMMAKQQEILAERAARGDQKAIAALNMLMMNAPR